MIKTLVFLLGVLTLGTLILMLIETAPIESEVPSLIATRRPAEDYGAIVRRTRVPLQPMKWRGIVVHATAAEGNRIEARCHFVAAADGTLQVTNLWDSQAEARHIEGPNRRLNADSIAVCLAGDFRRHRPTGEQFRTLVHLVRALQRACHIPGDSVYLYRHLHTRTDSPGAAFPTKAFDSSLLRTLR